MRTKSAQAVAVIANPSHSARALVTVYSSAGVAGPVWGAGSAEGQLDPVLGVEISQDVDSFRTARVTLKRQQGLYSLAPMVITGNPLYGAEAPVHVARRIVIEGELQLPDMSNTPAGLRETIFDGYIDELEWPTDEMVLVCTDKSAKLRDTWIEIERVYCLAQGVNAVKGCLVWRYDLPALALNELVLPSQAKSNAHFYKVTVAGAQSVVEPVWPIGAGATVVSGGVTFTEAGAISAATGLALETLIQQVLNDNGLGSLVTLQTPVSPAWQVKYYLQQRQSLQEAIQAMVNQLGWWSRFEWSAGLGRYELTLAQPDRASVTVHKVLDQVEEKDCTELGLAVWDIRNVVRVIYGDGGTLVPLDPQQNPVRITREVVDAASVAKYGRRFMEIAEDNASNVDTAAEADRMGNGALADLKEPLIGTAYSFPCDFYLELGDRITLPADTLRFTTAQTLAVGSLKHAFVAGSASTSVTLRGQPAAQHGGWLDLDGRKTKHDVHQIANFNTSLNTFSTASVVGGQKFSVTNSGGGRTKRALNQGYELHLSTTPGTTPSAATLKAAGESDTFVVADLVPAKQYYWKVVPTSKNSERIVRGSPSLEQSVIAGRANAGHYNSLVSQGHFPLNGNFEHATDDLAVAPFDHWAMRVGSWGGAGGMFWGNDAVYGNYLDLRGAVGDYAITSSAFPVRRMGGHFNIYMSVRPEGTVTATRRLIVYVRFYRKSDLSDAPILFTHFVPHTVAAVGVWANYVIPSEFIGALPNDVNFCTISFGKEDITSAAYGWFVGDLFFSEAQQEDLWATTRAFLPTIYGLSTTAQSSIFQEAWTAVTFQNSFANFNAATHQPCAYMKDSMGFVRLRGLAARASAALSTAIFTLPAGFRPAREINIDINAATKHASVAITTAGVVQVYAADSATWYTDISLNGINFDTR